MPDTAGAVEQPLFIMGVGRSGSSIFFQLLARHPQVSWLSRVSDLTPGRSWVNRLVMRGLDSPALFGWLTRYADPSEAYGWWDRRYPGFSRPCRDLVAADVTALARTRIIRSLAANLTPRRTRALVKITGWPRTGFLYEIFPDARFIHVLRDGRPVASSFLNVDWWLGWRGPTNWLWGDLSAEHEAEWEAHDRSFIALAGIQWKLLMDAMERARAALPPGRFLDIRYEDLCADPVTVYRRATEFAGLSWTPGFERTVRRAGLRSENEKWRRDFSPAQQRTLEAVLGPYLERYGYPLSHSAGATPGAAV